MSHEVETLTEEEQTKFVLYFHRKTTTLKQRTNQIRDRLIVLLMLDAGLRVGEVMQLQVCDIHFAESPVNMLTIRPETSKSHKSRTIPLTTRIRDTIQEIFLNVWGPEKFIPTCYAFSFGGPGSSVSIRQVQRITETAGICSIGRPVHPHMLRHTFATRLLHKCDIRTVQQLLGHTQLSSTQIYTHVNTQDTQNAIDALDPQSCVTTITEQLSDQQKVHKEG